MKTFYSFFKYYLTLLFIVIVFQVFAQPTYVTSYGGLGTGNGQLYYAVGIAIDRTNGWIYVADRNNERIQKFTMDGTYLLQWGSLGTGNGQFASNGGAEGINVDADGNVWVVDRNNHRVQKFNSNGTYLMQLGVTSTYSATNGYFRNPDGVGIHPTTGNIYVCDRNNERVQVFNSFGVYQFQFGTVGTAAGQFYSNGGCVDISFDADGNVWICDRNNHRMQKFTSTGTYLMMLGSTGTYSSVNGYFYYPEGIEVHPVTGDIYVADRNNERIQVFNSSGVFQYTFGTLGSGNGQFASNGGAVDIAFDANGDLYVMDRNNHRFQKWDVVVDVTTPVSVAITSSTNVTCNGGSNGSITATATPGTANYDYAWSNGSTTSNTSSTTNTITSLSAGTYTVTVTDDASSTATASVTITQPLSLNATIVAYTSGGYNGTTVTCNGYYDGGLQTNASGGTTPYMYAWNNGATTAAIAGIGAGTYTVTITDNKGCTKTKSQIVTQPTTLTSSISTNNNVSCNGYTDGSITASASGGSSPYIYSWNTGGTSATESGLGAGTYTVTIQDNNGCTSSSSKAITQPTAVSASISTNNNASCNGIPDGSLTASGTGGTSPYYYAWNNGGTTSTETSLSAGTYSVTITDNEGCTARSSKVITQPQLLVASIVVDSNVSCNGYFDGGLTSSASGGTMPYYYAWNNGATTASVTGLSAGTYSVTITDNNGCTSSNSGTITEPASMVASIVVDSNASCNGYYDGGLTSSASGGTTPYYYAWNNGATTASVTGLSAGTYSVTITDNNGCTSSKSETVTQPTSLSSTITINSNVSCNGYTDGSLTASGTGGSTPYIYAWNTGGTTATETSLGAGTYSVTITDNNGCTSSTSKTITQPTSVAASITTNNNVSCNGYSDGSLTASAGGGTSPYLYSWNNGATTATVTGLAAATYSVTITDNNSCTSVASKAVTQPVILSAHMYGYASPPESVGTTVSCNGYSNAGLGVSVLGGTSPNMYSWSNGATTATIVGISAGAYSVTVTDNNSCTATSIGYIGEPQLLVATIVVDSNASCNGYMDGGLTSSASGGTTPYYYAWNNGATTASVTGLLAGTYTVTITDDNGCTSTNSETITEPASLAASTIVDSNVSCNSNSDGAATASAIGGTTPYSYYWGTGATTASISGLPAASYSVLITDNNSCTSTSMVTITEPEIFVASAIVDEHVSCSGFSDGEATASATGGTTPYSYLWSNGGTTATITGLSSATYMVTVTDHNSCTYSSSITVTEPTSLIASSVVDENVSCNGYADGGMTANAIGGTTPYIYSWSNSATTASIAEVIAGTYTVTITDNNGCTTTSSGTITEPVSLLASTIVDRNTSCNSNSDGAATASAIGGTTPYSYLWNTGATTASISGLPAASYTVIITDNNSCTSSSMVTITEPDIFVASTVVDEHVSCNGFSDGEATASATGGTTPYSYLWSNGGTTATITGLSPETYIVTVTDHNSCSYSSSISITEPTSLIASSIVDENASCNDSFDGEATASAIGGTTPYSYLWSNGSTTASVSGLNAGTYSVIVTDNNSCTSSSSVTITEPALFVVGSIMDEQIICYETIPNELTGTAPSGGVIPYIYQWQSSTDNVNFSDIQGATGIDYQPETLIMTTYYRLNQTSASSCGTLATNTITVEVYDEFIAGSISGDQSICPNTVPNEINGTAPTGGNTPYLYQWQSSTDNINFSDILTATNINYQPESLANTNYFRLKQSSSNSCGMYITNVITITVEDDTPPTFTKPDDMTIYKDANCLYNADVIITGDVINETDNCEVGEAMYSDQIAEGLCEGEQILTRTWSLSDVNGNAALDQVQIITIKDDSPPTYTAPDNITIYKDENCVYDAAVLYTGDVTDEADNCEIGEATYSDLVNDADPCAIIITRTWSLTDACGNAAADQVQTITVEDNTLPTYTAPTNIIIYKDENCAYDAAVLYTGDVTDEADNCEVGEATYSDMINDTDACAIIITRTWSLTDACGNAAADQIQTITVEDNTLPTYTAPTNITIYKDENCAYDADVVYTGDVTDEADNCEVGEATYSDLVNDADPCAIIITRTWSLTDACGNAAADQIQTITIKDDTAPTFTAPDNITIYKDENCTYDADVVYTGDVADEADNCEVGEATYSDLVNDADPCAIIITRTWSLTDACGNAAADQVQTITIEDNTLPTYTAPTNITIYKDENCTYDADVVYTGDVADETDNCEVGEANYSDLVNDADPCAIIITRTWSLTDACGNAAADQVQIITVEDNTIPTFTAPDDITIYKDENCTYDADVVYTGDVTDEADNCEVGEATYSDLVNDADPCAIIITRTWSLTDACGNAAADQVQIITVEDNTLPTYTAPINITIYKDENCTYDADVVYTGDVADEADNCEVGEATYSDLVNDADPCAIIITRTWSLTDACGNAAADQVQTITIEDNTLPTFTAPDDITIYKEENCAYDAAVLYTGDVTDETDNCEVGEASYSDLVNDADPCAIIITRTWSLTDACGNAAADQVQTITIEDNTLPTFTAPDDITIYKDENCAYDAAVLYTGDVIDEADNCEEGEAIFIDELDDTDPNMIVITRTWSLEDACGNTAEDQVQIITVVDNTPPVAVCVEDQEIFITSGCKAIIEDYTYQITVSDNCGIATIEQYPEAGTVYTQDDLGLHTITLTVTDLSGNTSVCSFELTVTDKELFMIEEVTATNVICYGEDNGTISIITSGGSSGLFYSIDGLDYTNTTGQFTGLAPGNYTVSVKNTNDCFLTWSTTIVITEPAVLKIDNVLSTDVIGCYGYSNGSIEIIASGGTPNYYYSIDGGASFHTNNVFEDLLAGDYEVIIVDANVCETSWATTITINQPDAINYIGMGTVDIMGCFGDQTGQIHINAAGGTGVLRYSIDGGAHYYLNNGSFTGLSAGTYYLRIKDGNGCIYNHGEAIELTQPEKLVLEDISITDVTGCFDHTNGKIEVTATGGTPTLSYSIDGGVSYVNNDGLFDDIAQGEYDVFISDANGCVKSYVNNPVIVGAPSQVSMMVTSGDVSSCAGGNDGFISILATGGHGGYSYSINGGTTWETTADFTNIAAGEYIVMAKDDLGCEQTYASNPIMIGEPALITVSSLTTTEVSCHGSSDGEIHVSVTGGTGSLSYSIDGGSTYQSNPYFMGLTAGEYELMIQDDNQCEVAYENNPVVVSEPEAISFVEVITMDEDCSGELGSITIAVEGGNGTYEYSIDNGLNYQANNVFNDVASNSYIIRVKDAEGCMVLYPNNPVVIGQETMSLFVDVSPDHWVCMNEEVVLTAISEDATSFEWDPDGQTTSEITVSYATPGLYYFTVRAFSDYGCEATVSAPVIVKRCKGTVGTIIPSPIDSYDANVSFSYEPSSEVCLGETITIEANADGAIQYEWLYQEESGPITTVQETEAGSYYYPFVLLYADTATLGGTTVYFGNCTGISELDSRNISIYPNPNDGIFTLTINGVSQEVEITVLDFSGRHILEEKLEDIQDHKLERQYNFNEYERGVYFFQIKHGESVSYKKVIVN